MWCEPREWAGRTLSRCARKWSLQSLRIRVPALRISTLKATVGRLKMSHATGDLLADRRALIGFLIQSHRKHGGRVRFPLGLEGQEDRLLDCLDVDRLLQALTTDRHIELVHLRIKNGPGLSRLQSLIGSDIGSPNPSHHKGNSLDSAWEHAGNEDAGPLKVKLAELEIGLEDDDLQEIAFTLFSLCCAKPKDDFLVECVRRQLELSAEKGEDIGKMIMPLKSSLGPLGPQLFSRISSVSEPTSQELTCATLNSECSSPTVTSATTATSSDPSYTGSIPGTTSGANLELILTLIKQVRPKGFRKFTEFVRWRRAAVHILVETLRYATHTSWKGDRDDELAKSLVARLKGAVRRLSCVDADDFYEEEYAEAADQAVYAAQEVVKHITSGWQFSWGLRVKLWQAYLSGIFDGLDEGIYIATKEKYLSRLQKYLAPKLEISPLLHKACYTWVHFQQFAQNMKPEMLSKLRVLLEDLKRAENDEGGNALDTAYTQKVIQAMVEWVESQMLDYHLTLPEPQNMEGLLGLLVASASTEESRKELVMNCVASSLSRAFQRLVARVNDSEPTAALHTLAKQVEELFEVELRKYTKHLAPFCETAAAIAAQQLHNSYGQELLPQLQKLDSLPNDVISMLQAVDDLEGILLPHMIRADGSPSPCTPWNVLTAVAPVIIEIVRSKVSQLHLIAGRLLEGEEWVSASESEPVSHSAVELKQLLFTSLGALFDMDLPVPKQAVLILLQCYKDEITKYGESVIAALGDRDEMIPPLPARTRYKKDLAKIAEESEAIVTPRKHSLKRFGVIKKEKTKEASVSVVQDISESKAFHRVSQMTTWNLLVRVNSLHFMKESVPELCKVVEAKWNDHHAATAGEPPSPTCISSEFGGAQQAIEIALTKCCEFMGTKIVFWDMRKMWLEELHRHKVQKGGLDAILGKLNKYLTSLSEGALADVLGTVAEGLVTNCAKCYERVLLDGGASRLFLPSDVDVLESDVARFKDFFQADGEGLNKSTVDTIFLPASNLLTAMTLDTSVLISSANKAAGKGTQKTGPPSENPTDNLEVLTRILGHRRERDASKWLKKHFKVPKKTK